MLVFFLVRSPPGPVLIFFFNATATTAIYTLSLHDALPICVGVSARLAKAAFAQAFEIAVEEIEEVWHADRKSTLLNSSHLVISYAVFCLKKKPVLIELTTQEVPAAPTPNFPTH